MKRIETDDQMSEEKRGMTSEVTRTEYSARNTSVALISRIIAILMGYATRVVFTRVLSDDYVGVSGLFTDIVNVLSLSELGMETAITYALYGPIARGDIEKQKSVMALYRTMYRYVALIITVAGALLIPFLGLIVKEPGEVTNLTLIYILYLLNTVVSYLFIYRKTLMDASQIRYVGVAYHTLFLVIQDTAQIAVLLYTRNFILFLLIYLLCTIGYNVFTSRAAARRFPYLLDREAAPLPTEEKQDIFKNIKAMLMHKIGNVVVNNTDNILLSAMTGVANAGIYSNNFLIFGSIRQVLNEIFQGITASVGNLSVTEDEKKAAEIFECAFFVDQWLFGFASVCLLELLAPFAVLSYGAKQYGYALFPTVVICLNFYVTGMRQATIVYRDACGLFYYDRYKAFAEALINILASVLLTLRFGFVGVFLGTFVSTMLTSFWVEPYVLYKYKLKKSTAGYFGRYLFYTAVTLAAAALTYFCCVRADDYFAFSEDMYGLTGRLLVRALICVVVVNGVYLLCYCRTKEFALVMRKAAFLYEKKWKRRTGEKTLTEEEKTLLELLRAFLRRERSPQKKPDASLVHIAKVHSVVPFLFEHAWAQEELEPEICEITDSVVMQSYHLLFETARLCRGLEAEGIGVIVLKGAAVASFYPVPEYRKSGDIDLLLKDVKQKEDAVRVVQEMGYHISEVQDALHQIVLSGRSGIDVELHVMLAEPFDNQRINLYMNALLPDIAKHGTIRRIMGFSLPILDDHYQAYELLLHMLQHFLRRGFGLKLLCDWSAYWNTWERTRAGDEQAHDKALARYLVLVEESGVAGFSDMVTGVCAHFIGLSEETAKRLVIGEKQVDLQTAVQFLREVFDGGEFGDEDRERMVMLRGRGFGAYVREFHHQMHLNYPRAGRIVLLWPPLWVATLAKFMYNNRRIRRLSGFSILKRAGERSGIMNKMDLWKVKKRR